MPIVPNIKDGQFGFDLHSPFSGNKMSIDGASPSSVFNDLEGTPYASMQRSNPYADGPSISRTWWDKFVNFLGFNSKYDNSVAEYQKAAKEYDAQLHQIKFENEYNSASAQRQRLLEAGINPDLSDVSAGEASGFDQTQTSPDVSAAQSDLSQPGGPLDMADRLKNGLASVLTLTQGGFSIAQSVLGLKSTALANDAQSLKNLGLSSDLSKSLASLFTPPTNTRGIIDMDFGSSDNKIAKEDFHSFLVDDITSKGVSRAQAQAIANSTISYINSPEMQSRIFENAKNVNDKRSELVKDSYFNPFHADQTNSFINSYDKFTDTFMRKINNALIAAYNHNTNYASEFARFNSRYWSKRDGWSQAELENSTVDFQKHIVESQQAMRKAFDDCVSWLSSIANDPNAYRVERFAANTALTTMFLGSSGMLPNVSFGSSSGNKKFSIGF